MRPWRFLRLRDIAHSLRKEWAKVRERYVRNRAIRLIRRSGLFDDAWYLKENPDVATSGIDPARHYLLHGWLEGGILVRFSTGRSTSPGTQTSSPKGSIRSSIT